jgi:hypothetical protein
MGNLMRLLEMYSRSLKKYHISNQRDVITQIASGCFWVVLRFASFHLWEKFFKKVSTHQNKELYDHLAEI